MSECDKLANEFKDPMNRILEILILIIVIALGAIVFFEIMTPIESSLLYGVGDFLRFGGGWLRKVFLSSLVSILL